LIEDQNPVEQFAANAADETLGDGVGPRCTYGCSDDLDVDGSEDRVEAGGGLGVAVTDEEPEPPVGVVGPR
jgi:hypothetical protein